VRCSQFHRYLVYMNYVPYLYFTTLCQ
jgi:hypothetical protein